MGLSERDQEAVGKLRLLAGSSSKLLDEVHTMTYEDDIYNDFPTTQAEY